MSKDNRDRTDRGRYTEKVSPEDVLQVFSGARRSEGGQSSSGSPRQSERAGIDTVKFDRLPYLVSRLGEFPRFGRTHCCLGTFR